MNTRPVTLWPRSHNRTMLTSVINSYFQRGLQICPSHPFFEWVTRSNGTEAVEQLVVSVRLQPKIIIIILYRVARTQPVRPWCIHLEAAASAQEPLHTRAAARQAVPTAYKLL